MSILVRSSAGRKAAAVRKQMLLAKPCAECGGDRDSHKHPRCKKCRSEDNRAKKDRAIRHEVERLIFKAGITENWPNTPLKFEDAPKTKRKQAA